MPRNRRVDVESDEEFAALKLVPTVTGADVVALARTHLGEEYILGARAPMGDSTWAGPWDCAEFVSWCVYQRSRVLFGVKPRTDPMLADAFTGYWYEQALEAGALITYDEAALIEGALLLRLAVIGRVGHIAFSDGKGGTVEAHGSARGVTTDKVSGRRWDHGILVPGLSYFRSEKQVNLQPPPDVLRLTVPLTKGPTVLKVQKKLAALGFAPGIPDGIYGPQTAAAVQLFQASTGLVADGEVGSVTVAELKF